MKILAEFKECPNCKVDSRLMGSIVWEEIAKGFLNKDILGCISAEIYCNVDPNRPPIVGGRIPGARVYRDICTKCGKEYVVRIDFGYLTVPASPNSQPIFS